MWVICMKWKNRPRIMLNEHLHLKIAFSWSEGPSFILKPCSSPWFERGSFHTLGNLNWSRGLFHILQSSSQTYLFCLEAWKVLFPINKFKRLCSLTQFSSSPAWSEPICEFQAAGAESQEKACLASSLPGLGLSDWVQVRDSPILAVLVPRRDKWVLCYGFQVPEGQNFWQNRLRRSPSAGLLPRASLGYHLLFFCGSFPISALLWEDPQPFWSLLTTLSKIWSLERLYCLWLLNESLPRDFKNVQSLGLLGQYLSCAH